MKVVYSKTWVNDELSFALNGYLLEDGSTRFEWDGDSRKIDFDHYAFKLMFAYFRKYKQWHPVCEVFLARRHAA